MNRRAAVIAWLAASGCGGASAHEPGGGGAGAGEHARTVRIARGEVHDHLLLSGELGAASALDLSAPQIEGTNPTIRWLADDGAQVKQGDRVVELDNTEWLQQLETQRLQAIDAEIAVRNATTTEQLDASSKAIALRTAQIELEKAKLEAGVPADLLTAREAEDRQLKVRHAELALAKAEQDVAEQKSEATFDHQLKDIALAKAKHAVESAETMLHALAITAPRDGTVVVQTNFATGHHLRVGDTVWPGMQMVSLPDWSKGLVVDAELSDVDDRRIAVGDRATCTLDAYPRESIACAVTSIAPVATHATGSATQRQEFAVALSFAAIDVARMRPGMSVRVDVAHPAVAGVVVPRGAIAGLGAGSGSAQVQLATGETRAVAIDTCDEQACTIASGVADGDELRIGDPP